MPEDRPDPIGLRVEIAERQVVDTAFGRGRLQPNGDARDGVVVDLRALDEEHVQGLVAPLGEEQRLRGHPVAPGATRLLVVGLDGSGHGGVRDRPHVGLVDTHAERVRRHDDIHVTGHEAPLSFGTLLAAEPRVVGDDLDAECPLQIAGQPLDLRPRPRVHDRGPRLRLGQRREQASRLVGARFARDDGEAEVRAVEARRHHHRVAKPQAPGDIPRDLWRRGGRRGEDRLRPKPAGGVGQTEVVGPEVMPPLRHAVRLVDDEQPDVDVAHRLEEAGGREALRRDVQQAHLPSRGGGDRPAVRGCVLLGVDQRGAGGRDPLQRLHLVLHQRDQRRDDDRQVAAHERRELVAERLPGAGRHDHEHVAAGQRGGDGLGLAGPEVLESEVLLQRSPGGIHRPPDLSGASGGRPRAARSRHEVE